MHVEVAIIGGGIAGLSCAANLGSDVSAVVLEAEPTLGYHATGRSAALYTECYGSRTIHALTTASRTYLTELHPQTSTPRGLMFVAPSGDEEAIANLMVEFGPLVPSLLRLTPTDVEQSCGLFPTSLVAGGVYEKGARDIDVDALLSSFASTARVNGVTVMTSAPVTAIERSSGGWTVVTSDFQYTADVVVNAAGAWGDRIAAMAGVAPLGLIPLARSVFTCDPGQDPQAWPMIVDARERWYLKPEGPHLLGSGASEIPSEPMDARVDERDVALGIEKVTTASTLNIRSVKNTWAGLRTFAPDRIPVAGFDPDHPGFFWLVGQGGYGIMTSPALGALAGCLVRSLAIPEELSNCGVSVEDLDPLRLR
ncbi:MAG: FAD-binding oxidoreductase [Acidimicrobiia bacterium]|nr:FAD-binding oxidoreductase [Acidimicrobiia bacterium]